MKTIKIILLTAITCFFASHAMAQSVTVTINPSPVAQIYGVQGGPTLPSATVCPLVAQPYFGTSTSIAVLDSSKTRWRILTPVGSTATAVIGDSTAMNTNITFDNPALTPANLTVRLYLESNKGCSDTIDFNVTVNARVLMAITTHPTTSVCAEVPTPFAATAQGGTSPRFLKWRVLGLNGTTTQATFGDSTLSSTNITFINNTNAIANLKVVAYYDNGASATCPDIYTDTVSVDVKPRPQIAATTTTNINGSSEICSGLTSQFTLGTKTNATFLRWEYMGAVANDSIDVLFDNPANENPVVTFIDSTNAQATVKIRRVYEGAGLAAGCTEANGITYADTMTVIINPAIRAVNLAINQTGGSGNPSADIFCQDEVTPSTNGTSVNLDVQIVGGTSQYTFDYTGNNTGGTSGTNGDHRVAPTNATFSITITPPADGTAYSFTVKGVRDSKGCIYKTPNP